MQSTDTPHLATIDTPAGTAEFAHNIGIERLETRKTWGTGLKQDFLECWGVVLDGFQHALRWFDTAKVYDLLMGVVGTLVQ